MSISTFAQNLCNYLNDANIAQELLTDTSFVPTGGISFNLKYARLLAMEGKNYMQQDPTTQNQTNYVPQQPMPMPQQPNYQYPPQQYQQTPMYQPPMQQPPKKKSKAGCIVAGTFLALVVIIVVIMMSANNPSANSGTLANGNTSYASTTPSSHHFKVGDTVKVGDIWQATVSGAKTTPGGQYDQATGVYLEVTVSLKNISSQEQAVSSLIMFTLRDSTGKQYTEALVTDGTTTPDGKVEAGSPISGTIAYDVPTTLHAFTFAFEPSITDQGQTIWDISA